AAEGYIDLEPNRPARVSPMNYESLRSFFLAAPLIYIATTQIAATSATPAEIDRLKKIQTDFRSAIDKRDVIGRMLHNEASPLQMGRMVNTAYLRPSLRRLLIDPARLGRVFYRNPTTSDMQAEMNKAVHQHEQIIEAIERHDPAAAAEIVRAHM